jgi:biotin carboxylase
MMEGVPTVLLILPSATYRAPEFLEAAAELGVTVVTGSDAPSALAPIMGERAIALDLDDPVRAAQAIVDLDRTMPLDAVVGVDDQGLLTAALASERLGLAANPPAAIAATRNKADLRTLLDESEVHQPRFEVIRRAPGMVATDVVAAARRVGFPVVIKPSNQAASRGVIRADNEDEARQAAERIDTMLQGDGDHDAELLVEGFVAGEEIAIEAMLTEGRLEVLAYFDKPDPLDGPFFEETIYVTPSRLDPQLLAASARLLEQACRAIGLVDGPVHGEVRLSPAGSAPDGPAPDGIVPVLIEVAARTIGGRCAQTLSFSRGRSLEAVVLEHALGRNSASAHQTLGASGVMMLPIPRSGHLVEVRGRERALATPGVTDLQISIAPGKEIRALPEGNRYLGFLFARGAKPADVERSLRQGHAELEIVIESFAMAPAGEPVEVA